MENEETTVCIGENLKKHRIQRGLKQEELCAGVCSVSQLSKIETGKIQAKPEYLEEFSRRLGIVVDKLWSVDANREELEQKLALIRRLRNVNQIKPTFQLLQEVIQQSLKLGYHDLYVDAVYLKSRNFEFLEDWGEVSRLISDLLSSNKVTEPGTLIELWGQIGFAYQNNGDMGTAYSCFAQVEHYIHLIHEDHPHALRLYFAYGVHQYALRKYREAYHFAKKALTLAESSKILFWRLRILNMCSLILNRLGEQREYRYALLMSCLQEAEDNSMMYDAGVTANNLGTFYLVDQDLIKARHYQEISLRIAECVPNSSTRTFLCESIYELAMISVFEGKWRQVEDYLSRLRSLCEETKFGKYNYVAKIHLVRARMAQLKGDIREQIHQLQGALAIYDAHHVYLEADETAVKLAQALEEQGDFVAATHMYKCAVDFQRKFEAVVQKKR